MLHVLSNCFWEFGDLPKSTASPFPLSSQWIIGTDTLPPFRSDQGEPFQLILACIRRCSHTQLVAILWLTRQWLCSVVCQRFLYGAALVSFVRKIHAARIDFQPLVCGTLSSSAHYPLEHGVDSVWYTQCEKTHVRLDKLKKKSCDQLLQAKADNFFYNRGFLELRLLVAHSQWEKQKCPPKEVARGGLLPPSPSYGTVFIHSHLFRVLPIFTDTNVPLFHDAKLFIINSLGLPPASLPIQISRLHRLFDLMPASM